MKYSNYIGAALIIAFIGICYLPWIYIPGQNGIVTGFQSANNFFGKPGLLNIVLYIPAFVFFLVPKIWAKRTNLIFTALGVAWAVRNYVLLPICRQGECPDKQAGLYLMLIASIAILAMSLFPDIKLPAEKK